MGDFGRLRQLAFLQPGCVCVCKHLIHVSTHNQSRDTQLHNYTSNDSGHGGGGVLVMGDFGRGGCLIDGEIQGGGGFMQGVVEY